jgi:hypothetical protein
MAHASWIAPDLSPWHGVRDLSVVYATENKPEECFLYLLLSRRGPAAPPPWMLMAWKLL